MIGQLIQLFKKSWKLRRISKKLSEPFDVKSIESMLSIGPKRDAAINELVDLCLEGHFRREVISKYSTSREDSKSIY